MTDALALRQQLKGLHITCCTQLRAELDRATCGWLSAGAALLPAVSQEAGWRGCKVTHCIVSTGQLVATLGEGLVCLWLDR